MLLTLRVPANRRCFASTQTDRAKPKLSRAESLVWSELERLGVGSDKNVSTTFSALIQELNKLDKNANPSESQELEDRKAQFLETVHRKTLETPTRSIYQALPRGSDANALQEKIVVPDCSVSEATCYDQLGKYLSIGSLLFRDEVPRSFERVEWNHRMQAGATIPLAEHIKKLTSRRPMNTPGEAALLSSTDDMRVMIREQAVDLCKSLKKAGDEKTGIARILQGERGTGKSATLIHAIAWARENDWLTMVLPRGSDVVTESGSQAYGFFNGLAILPDEENRAWFGQPNLAFSVLERTLASHGELLAKLPQKRDYSHELYRPKQGQPNLAHLVMRGMREKHRASRVVYDLRMEMNLVTEVPVLVAVDEFNALYWPTCHWFDTKPVGAYHLTLANAFRFVENVPGDTEDGCSYKSERQACVKRDHIPQRGAVIGALVNSKQAPSHQSKVNPCRFEDFSVKGCSKIRMTSYDEQELDRALLYYESRGAFEKLDTDDYGKLKVFSGGNPERVSRFSRNGTTELTWSFQ